MRFSCEQSMTQLGLCAQIVSAPINVCEINNDLLV